MSGFVKCGVCLIAPTGRSLRLELNDPNQVFTEIYYVSLKDLEDVLQGRKQTATIIKPEKKHTEA